MQGRFSMHLWPQKIRKVTVKKAVRVCRKVLWNKTFGWGRRWYLYWSFVIGMSFADWAVAVLVGHRCSFSLDFCYFLWDNKTEDERGLDNPLDASSCWVWVSGWTRLITSEDKREKVASACECVSMMTKTLEGFDSPARDCYMYWTKFSSTWQMKKTCYNTKYNWIR